MYNSGLSYVDRTKRIAESIENTLRSRFKTSETSPILFNYGGSEYNLRDRETRILIVAAIQNDYYREHGGFNQRKLDGWYAECNRRAELNPPKSPTERPSPVPYDSALMDRITDIVLYEDLTNMARNKISAVEYPILSERQLSRRYEHEYAEDLAYTYDSNRKNRAKPERRVRTSKERRQVDQEAKIRNRLRAARYRKFIGKQPIIEGASEPFTQCIGSAERWRAYIGREEIVEEREITENAA